MSLIGKEVEIRGTELFGRLQGTVIDLLPEYIVLRKSDDQIVFIKIVMDMTAHSQYLSVRIIGSGHA